MNIMLCFKNLISLCLSYIFREVLAQLGLLETADINDFLYVRGAQIFQKSVSHPKILGDIWVTQSKLDT